jgi:hypothetical protein
MLISFLIVLVFRVPAQRRFVRAASAILQPKRAFNVDLAVCLAAGLLAAAYNRLTFGFMLSSAGSLMIGCAVAGFFIILIGTDGIHETHNEAGDMFGQRRLREIIRKHADQSSASIKKAVIESLQDYRKKASQEDDITLVVIKLL